MKQNLGAGRALVALTVGTLVVLVVVIALAGSTLPLEHMSITIDGEDVALKGIGGGHAVLLVVALAAAVLLVLLIAACAVVFVFGVVALAIAVAVLAVLASLALAISPLVFIGWLIWRLLRPAAAASNARPATA
jgi:hypothetical protein